MPTNDRYVDWTDGYNYDTLADIRNTLFRTPPAVLDAVFETMIEREVINLEHDLAQMAGNPEEGIPATTLAQFFRKNCFSQ